MGRLHVVPDCVAVAADRLVVIVRVDEDGSVVVRDLASGRVHATDAAELRAPPIEADPNPDRATDIFDASDSRWELARLREELIAGIDSTGEVTEQAQRVAANLGVSIRTVFRWLALYREAPQTSSLLPRPMGQPAGSHRLDERVEHLITDVIRDVYLTKIRAKKEEVVRMVGLRCAAQGLKAPSRKPILARLKKLDPRQIMKARLQPGEAASLCNFVPGSYPIRRALEVVQIDHTPMDVIVVDEAHRVPIGRPWLTLAVDVAPRLVVGFYVTMEAPSSTSVALCLTHATLPKESWLKQRGLTCTWPVWGLPQALHADNGADFTAAALRRGCDEHGIRLILRPVATPHYGGHIERLIGTMMGRVHLLPGTTDANSQDKGEYPSEHEARLTMAELEKWLTLEICEQYHRRIHRGIHRSPLAAWEESVNGANAIGRCLPDQPEQFTISFLPICERKLRRDGLHLFNIRYWDNVLPSMVQLGASVIVRYDPRNLAKVFVLACDRRYYPIPYADLSLPPITLWEQRAALTKLHSEGSNAPAEVAIFQAVVEQRALIAQAAAKTRSARRQSQRRKDAGVDLTGRPRSEASVVDYSQPVLPSDAEVWDV